MSRTAPVRMSDVAREAGVARVTVSRVISDPASVAPATRAAVEAAIARLGYLPNLNAGSLASSRSRIVGAIVPTLSNAWFADTMDGLSDALSEDGYQLLLGQTRYDAAQEERLVDAFLSRRVDALVLTGTTHSPGIHAKLRRAAVPVVECWELAENPIDMAVGFDNAATGATAAAHLLARGCRHLGFVGSAEHRSSQRLDGFRRTVRAAHRGAVRVQLVQPPSSVSDGVLALAALLAAQPALDGVFCSNDTLALGLLQGCRQHGLAVPQRIAVIGFSDLPVAAASVPALTTVRIGARAIGTHAGEMLRQRLRGGNGAGTRMLDLGFELVVRESA